MTWGLCPQTPEILRITARISWTPGRAALNPGESRPPSRRSGCVSAEPYPPPGCNQYSRPETSTCGDVYTKLLTPPAILSVVASCRRLNVPLKGYLSATLPGMSRRKLTEVANLTPARWAASRA